MHDTDKKTGMETLIYWVGNLVFLCLSLALGIFFAAVFAPITGGF